MTTALYANVITFNLYNETGEEVCLKELIEEVVKCADTLTMQDKIQFELIATGFNYNPETKKYSDWTDSWLVEQLRSRLPLPSFSVYYTIPEVREHKQLRVFTVKRVRQARDLSYLTSR